MIIQTMPYPSSLDAYRLLAWTDTVEGGTLTLDGLDLTGYQVIMVSVDGMRVDTDSTDIVLRLSVDGAFRNSGYRYLNQAVADNNFGTDIASQAGTGIALTGEASVDATDSASWLAAIYNSDTALYKHASFDASRITSDARVHTNWGGGALEVTGTVDGVQILGENGLISAARLAVYALKSEDRTAADPAMTSLWVGNPSTTGASVVVRTNLPANVRLAYSTDSGLASPTYTAAIATTDRCARFNLSGLSSNTQYYYSAEIDGELDATIGKFKTLGGTTLKVCLSGDASSGSNADVFDDIRNEAPHFFIHLGDQHYDDNSYNSKPIMHGSYDRMLLNSRQAQLRRDIPTVWMWDDHDFCENDSHGGSVARDAACSVYRRRVPHHTLALSGETDPIYHSFEVSVDGVGVIFIMTDLRSAASNKTATDNSSKTMLGTTQKTWFKNILSDPANADKLFVWVCSRVWGGLTSAGADHWGGFTTERTELANHIRDNCFGRILVLSADMHSLAIDDGTNHNFASSGSGATPVFQAAPLDRTDSTTYGGATYSEGQFTNNGQYGIIEFSKTGALQITADLTGKRDTGATLDTKQFIFNL